MEVDVLISKHDVHYGMFIGLVVTGVVSSSIPSWSPYRGPYRGYYVVVLGKKAFFHSASLHTEFMFWGRGLTCDGLVSHPRGGGGGGG